MAALKIKQKIKTAPQPKLSPKRTVKAKPNISHKFEAQVSQETFLEIEADDILDGKEDYLEDKAVGQDETDNLIEYDAEELDIDDESNLDADRRDSIFDSPDAISYDLRPDIVLEEIAPYAGKAPATISVFIPSKIRSLIGNASIEHEIRTEALEKIGKLLAEQDRGFLSGENFDPVLISYKRQKDVARLIGKDETWITRLKQSCIVQTPRWGLQPLSIFFPEEIPSSIKDYSEAVKHHINNENPMKPLTMEELASLISQGDHEYKSLTVNAGSKLRRILERLSFPPPKERLKLAKIITEHLAEHENAANSELLDNLKNSGKKNISKLFVKHSSFSDKLIQKLKDRKGIK